MIDWTFTPASLWTLIGVLLILSELALPGVIAVFFGLAALCRTAPVSRLIGLLLFSMSRSIRPPRSCFSVSWVPHSCCWLATASSPGSVVRRKRAVAAAKCCRKAREHWRRPTLRAAPVSCLSTGFAGMPSRRISFGRAIRSGSSGGEGLS